jgi:hypothetical protein
LESSKSTNQQVDSCSSPEPEPGKLTVYYDGACPLCRREIDFYRRRGRAAPIEWVDAAAGDAELSGVDRARPGAYRCAGAVSRSPA